MVKFWRLALISAIKHTRRDIKHFEKHGIGKNAMKSKQQLQEQERKLVEMDAK